LFFFSSSINIIKVYKKNENQKRKKIKMKKGGKKLQQNSNK